MDTQAYRAKQFRDLLAGKYRSDYDIVLKYIVAKGEAVKREDIVDYYIKKLKLDPEAANGCVSYALQKLLKNKKIRRVDTGMYTVWKI